jgi:hypothetical protein
MPLRTAVKCFSGVRATFGREKKKLFTAKDAKKSREAREVGRETKNVKGLLLLPTGGWYGS